MVVINGSGAGQYRRITSTFGGSQFTIDQPLAGALSGFAEDLSGALERALEEPLPHSEKDPGELLAPFTWRAVFKRIKTAWLQLIG